MTSWQRWKYLINFHGWGLHTCRNVHVLIRAGLALSTWCFVLNRKIMFVERTSSFQWTWRLCWSPAVCMFLCDLSFDEGYTCVVRWSQWLNWELTEKTALTHVSVCEWLDVCGLCMLCVCWCMLQHVCVPMCMCKWENVYVFQCAGASERECVCVLMCRCKWEIVCVRDLLLDWKCMWCVLVVLCVCVCVCACVAMCMCSNVHVQVRECVWVSMCWCKWERVCVCVFQCTGANERMCACVNSCTSLQINMFISFQSVVVLRCYWRVVVYHSPMAPWHGRVACASFCKNCKDKNTQCDCCRTSCHSWTIW